MSSESERETSLHCEKQCSDPFDKHKITITKDLRNATKAQIIQCTKMQLQPPDLLCSTCRKRIQKILHEDNPFGMPISNVESSLNDSEQNIIFVNTSMSQIGKSPCIKRTTHKIMDQSPSDAKDVEIIDLDSNDDEEQPNADDSPAQDEEQPDGDDSPAHDEEQMKPDSPDREDPSPTVKKNGSASKKTAPPSVRPKQAVKVSPTKDVLLPLHRVKTIMKSCPDVETVSQDSLFLITKATELFVQYLAKESYKSASNPNKLDYEAVSDTVHSKDCFDFLRETIPKKISWAECQKIRAERKLL